MQEGRTATVVHAIPGRIRVRLDKPLRSREFMRSLAETLSQVEGVRQVDVNPTTGSLLLLYDPQLLSLEQLYLAARGADLTVVVPEAEPSAPPPTEISPVAARINSAFSRLDRGVFDLSGGQIDAKTLAPLGLGAVALRRIMTSGADLSVVPWYVLLWYSFEMFTKYNLRRGAR